MAGRIRIGVGGWTFQPWRGPFYPAGLTQKRELEYASHKLGAIEINGTYYGTQKRDSFVKWHAETPDDFVFTVKGPRFTTNRRVLAEAGESIEHFLASGVTELKEKLGPILWQFMPTKKWDPEDFGAFLALLPLEREGRRLRHAVEVRHPSFANPDFVRLARSSGVAIVVEGDSDYPLIPDPTADFVYARIMGTSADHAIGYSEAALDLWAGRALAWASGAEPEGLAPVDAAAPDGKGRDVYLYVISGAKERNPAAAMALMERISGKVA